MLLLKNLFQSEYRLCKELSSDTNSLKLSFFICAVFGMNSSIEKIKLCSFMSHLREEHKIIVISDLYARSYD
jgi:hypothetical protein